MFSTPPFIPQFGTGSPPGTVPTNQLFFDATGSIYVPYVYNPATLSWHEFGDGIGSVTSVGLALPVSVFSISGSPVTSAGTLTGSFIAQAANTIFAGPTTGASATPAFRTLVAADIPSLSGTYLPLAGGTMTGSIVNPNGSAVAPQFAFNTNYGLFYDSTLNGMAVSVAGVSLAAFTVSGYNQSMAGGGAMNISAAGEGSVQNALRRVSANINGSNFNTIKGRGTLASTAVPNTNDILGTLTFSGINTAGANTNTPGTRVQATLIETGTVSSTAMGSRLELAACPIGSGTLTTILSMTTALGLTLFGTGAANTIVDANRLIVKRAFTVATLPTGVNLYSEAFVTDATLPITTGLGLAPVGGGANKVPVYTTDGTNWTIG